MSNSDTPAKVGSSEGLGLSPKAGAVRVIPADLLRTHPLETCLKLADDWTQCDLDRAPQWRSVVYVLAQEVERLRAELDRCTPPPAWERCA